MFEFVNKILKGKGDGKGVVTVLLGDGQILEFPRRFRCSGLMASHPDHRVCLANALVLHQQVKLLPAEAFLEQGEIYLLLPKPSGRSLSRSASSSTFESASLLQDEMEEEQAAATSVKFVVSKQYLARILADSNSGRPPLTRSETFVKKVHKPMAVRRVQSVNLYQRNRPLDSISEAAS